MAYVEGQVLVPPGFGQDIREIQRNHKMQTMDVSSRPNSALDNEKVVSLTDDENDFFTVPSGKGGVHFGPDVEARDLGKISQRPISPLLGLGRHKTDAVPSNYLSQPMKHHPLTHGLAGHHILTADMFTKEQLNDIFNTAQTLRVDVLKDRPLDNILRGKVITIFILVPS